MKKLLILFAILFAYKFPAAQSDLPQFNMAIENLDRRGEVYFSFQLFDHSRLAELTKIISIDNIKGSTVYAYANRNEFYDFAALGYPYEVLTAPSLLHPALMTDNPQQVLTWDYYPTYPAYETLMQQFASDHPSICKLITIASLASGRKILALRISDNVNIQENEPEFLYTSSIHGDELTGYICMLHLADYLLSGYGTNQRITNMVNNTDIVICPLANPDGTYKAGNSSVNGATRGNANNIDLNRNYPDPRAGQHPDGNAWQAETVAFMNFAGENTFTMGANFHGGAEVINYPWDTWYKLTADDDWWIYVSRQYADTVHFNAPPGYLTDLNNGITNGAVWYVVTGGRQDYMNYIHHCREVTMEISDVKLLPANQLLAHWNYNYRSLLNYVEQAGYGLHGLITDSVSGQPLFSKVYIQSFDKDSSFIYSDPQVGDYHRLLKGGTYGVTFSAPGYYPKTFQVKVEDMLRLDLNVQLYNGSLATNFSADKTQVAVDQAVHFSDKSVGQPLTRLWTFEGGTPAVSTETNPIVTYNIPGSYAVKLKISRNGSVDSLVRTRYIDVKPWYLMSNKTYVVCEGNFYDSGGPLSPYSENESSIITFYPQLPIQKIKAVFNRVEIEPGNSGCSTDALLVYDGPVISGDPLATLCGNTTPLPVVASNPQGALTFKFNSNGAANTSGWDISLSCSTIVSEKKGIQDEVRIFPNPVTERQFTIESERIIQKLLVYDATGRTVSSLDPVSKQVVVENNWPSGIYIAKLLIQDKWVNKRIQVINN